MHTRYHTPCAYPLDHILRCASAGECDNEIGFRYWEPHGFSFPAEVAVFHRQFEYLAIQCSISRYPGFRLSGFISNFPSLPDRGMDLTR